MDYLKRYSEQALENVQISLLFVDENGIVRFANKAAGKFFGQKPSRMSGMHIHNLVHHNGLHPHKEKDCPLLNPFKNGRAVLRSPDVFTGKNKKETWVEYSAYTINEQNKVSTLLVSFLDAAVSSISRQQMADEQARYRSVFFEAIYPKIILNNKAKILEVNPIGQKIFGQNYEGKSLFEYMPNKSAKKMRAFWKKLLKQRQLSDKIELYVNKKRHIYLVNATAHIQPKEHLLIFDDITNEVVEQESRDQFIAVAGHELKTPLAVIKAYSELLQRKSKTDEKTSQYTQKIIDKVDILTKLINAMVDEIKLGAGRLEFNDVSMDVDEFLSKHIQEIQKIYPRIDISTKGQADTVIQADPERLSQVISNLVTNAAKYSRKGKKVIVNVKKEDNKVIIGVQDFGKGISKKEQAKLFDAFYRSPSVIKRNQPGLGLGLFISKQIINYYGGDMWVTSKWGKGSTFWFNLPVK